MDVHFSILFFSLFPHVFKRFENKNIPFHLKTFKPPNSMVTNTENIGAGIDSGGEKKGCVIKYGLYGSHSNCNLGETWAVEAGCGGW